MIKKSEKAQGLVLFLLALAALAGIAGGTGVYVDSQVKAKKAAEAQYADAKVVVTKLSDATQTQAEAVDKQAQAAIAQAEASRVAIEALQQQYKELADLNKQQMAALTEQLNAERNRDGTMVRVYEGIAIAVAFYAVVLVAILAAVLLWVMNKTEQFRNRLMEHSNIQIPAGRNDMSQVPMERPVEIYVSKPQREPVEVQR